ncbi:hypothetical protein [Pelagibius marinus]|uniref:hypothetical protein n=1 Tax=Pelagibius marinus TaxID=2762760 RepID=UPI001872226F|nr:hypothetical protein [Pelagibius marinus]
MCRFSQPFVTDKRIAFAVRRAGEIADRRREDSAFDCAAAAVRQVFGRWLLDHTAAVPPSKMPLYLRLVDEVEQRLGLHRRRRGVTLPQNPAMAAPLPFAPDCVEARASA